MDNLSSFMITEHFYFKYFFWKCVGHRNKYNVDFKLMKSTFIPKIDSKIESNHFILVKRGFHEATNRADERHKTADLWNYEKISTLSHRFVESAD